MNTAAGTDTSYEFKVELRDGLQRTIDWIRENATRYRPGEYAV